MSYNILSVCKKCLVVAALLALTVQFALASSASLLSRPSLTGSYEVVQSAVRGSQMQIRMRIHFVNHGPSDLSIQRLTLWDFSHPAKGGSHACAIALRSHASVDTIQEFTIQRSDSQMWQKGFRPRFVLQMAGAGSTKTKAVVRLDRISGQGRSQEVR
jgi:hypothetical protein